MRRKVLNIGTKVQNYVGEGGGANFSLAVNWSEPPPPPQPPFSARYNYISHIENWWYSKIKNRIEKYTFRNTFK